MRSIEKLSQEEKEVKVLIGSLKNVLTDVPYDFMWDTDNYIDDNKQSEDKGEENYGE